METLLHPSDPTHRFADLGLSEASLASIAAAGFTSPTPVQARALPPALAGRDVIATASTGTGKTLAFVLPIVERLEGRPGTRALVLAPTRELVQQIADVFRYFGRQRGVRCVEVVGGVGTEPQIRGLREQREVVVATPGRLNDLLQRGSARLGGIEVLVLDEADRMLDMGFRPQIDRILAQLPRRRQTLLLSATMGAEVARFARACLADPVRVETSPSGTLAARAEQRVFHVAQQGKSDLLLALLAEDEATTLVFTRTKHRAERLAKVLSRCGHRVDRIHGDRSQSQRQAALAAFRQGQVRVLVATDVAARGLDVEEIAQVVNFDLSLVPDDHVHRVGRTARASASGRASSFCAPDEVDLLRAIERVTRTSIPRAELPRGIASPRAIAPQPVANVSRGVGAPTSEPRHDAGRYAPRRDVRRREAPWLVGQGQGQGQRRGSRWRGRTGPG